MTVDADHVAVDYMYNLVMAGANGTQSAHNLVFDPGGSDDSEEITFLDSRPNQPPTDDPPVYYLDAREALLPEAQAPEDYYLRRLFWRSHIEELCAEEGLVSTLQQRCITAADQPGGDPDACTACVEVAEMHMPELLFGYDDSKCAKLGFTSGGGLPPEFLDRNANPPPLSEDAGLPRYARAFNYCTGTPPGELNETVLSEGPTTTVSCPYPLSDAKIVTNRTVRIGTIWTEDYHRGFEKPLPVGPWVAAFTETRTADVVDEERARRYDLAWSRDHE